MPKIEKKAPSRRDVMRWSLLAAGLASCGFAAAIAPAIAADQVEINWWGWAPSVESAAEYIDGFSKLHPEIKVTFKNIPYADYTQALRLGLVSNSGPDVYNLEPGVITSQYARFGADLGPAVEKALGADWKSKLSPVGVLDFTVDETLKGLPVQVGGAGQLWYNKDMLDKHGVQPPKTLAEWEAVCATLKTAGETCFVQGAKDAWVDLDTYIAIAQSIAPGKVMDAVEGKVKWTDPDLVQALTIWQTLFNDGIMQEGALGISQYPDARNRWQTGNAAFVMMGTWHADSMSAPILAKTQEAAGAQPVKFVSLPLDFPDVGGKGNAPGLFGGADYGLAVSAKSTKQEAAEAFATYLATSEDGAKLVAAHAFPPALLSVKFAVPDLVDPALQGPAVDKINADLAAMAASRQIPYADLKVALSDALSAVAAGTTTPDEAAATVEAVSAQTER